MGNPAKEEDPYWELEVYMEKTQQEINKLVSTELQNGTHEYHNKSFKHQIPSAPGDSWTDNIFAGLRSVVEKQLSEIELESLPPYLPPTPPQHRAEKDSVTSRGDYRCTNKKGLSKVPLDGSDVFNFHSRHKYLKDHLYDGISAVDATTQTTPYNLSRSSSFTWITGGDSSTLMLSGSSASIVSSSPSEASNIDGGFLDDTSISLSDTVSVREDPEESGIGTSSPKPSRQPQLNLVFEKGKIKEIARLGRRHTEDHTKVQQAPKEDVWLVQDTEDIIELKVPSQPATSLPTTPSEEGWNTKLDNFGILSNSAPVLEGQNAKQQMGTPARCHSAKAITEVEALEACSWLKHAGFPQYAQMYEAMKFPVDLGTVQRDHPFLDGDALCALFRRLKVLNQCAQLRLGPPVSGLESDDEDDDCALSENWSLDRKSRRWSRTPGHLEDQDNPLLPRSTPTRRTNETAILNGSPKAHRGGSSLKGGFMKRMGSLRRRGKSISDDPGSSPPLPGGNKHERSPSGSTRNLFSRKSTSKRPPLATPKNGRHSATDIRKIEVEDEKLSDNVVHNIYNVGFEQPQSSNESLASGSLNMTSTSSSMTSASNEDNSHQRSISPWPVVQSKDSTLTPLRHPVPIASLCCSQLQLLRKWALLHLTSVLERYCPSNKSFKHWDLPKFLRKMKTPDYKEKVVFGVPFTVIAQRTGLPLPPRVLHAMKFIKTSGIDQVGIFRKSGVRSRIQKLRMMWEADTDSLSLDESQAYDVADLIKQYFRDVPEGLLNNKFSDTLVAIFQYLPSKLRREALLATLLLLPDEHREVLHTLMKFLADVAQFSSVNQMTPSNLAVCFAPSLFHTGPSRSASSSPRRKKAVGAPGPRELSENKAAHECLTMLIQDCDSLFRVPMDVWMHCKYSYLDVIEWETLKRNTINDQKTWERYIQETVKLFHKEVKESPRRWVNSPSRDPAIEMSYKKVEDGHPVRLWQITTEVEAPPSEVLFRILRERWMWDWSLIQATILDTLSPTADIFQYSTSSVPGEPFRDYCVLRFWEVNVQGPCTLVETSVDHPKASLSSQGVRGVVLASRYLIEPCGGGRSRIIHFSRVDTMGRSRDWYNKIYGHILALGMSRIRESFSLYETLGPESKV